MNQTQIALFGLGLVLLGMASGLAALLWRNRRLRFGQVKLMTEIERLMDSERVLGKSLSLMAHHISAPLNYARSISGLLEQRWDGFEDSERRSTASLLSNQLVELSEQFAEVLAWARKKQLGQSTLEEIGLSEFARIELGRLAGAAAHKEVKMELQIHDSSTVVFDRQAASLVLQNLLSNALKFSVGGQKITLEAGMGNPGFARFMVRDEAGGIGRTELDRLFSSKNHLAKEGTARESGSGIGLLLSQDLLLGLGTSLVARSAVEQGSEFSFEIPIER